MLQIDMRMPNNCINCNLSHDYVCMVTERYLDEDLCGAYGETRPEWCPLKEQTHDGSFIVIDTKTGEEADTYNIALHEDWANHLCYCDMEGWAIEDDGSLLLVDECGRFAYADRERFKVKWNGIV